MEFHPKLQNTDLSFRLEKYSLLLCYEWLITFSTSTHAVGFSFTLNNRLRKRHFNVYLMHLIFETEFQIFEHNYKNKVR